jgi:RNA polymerase sigma-70 factor (ECF subfamily)
MSFGQSISLQQRSDANEVTGALDPEGTEQRAQHAENACCAFCVCDEFRISFSFVRNFSPETLPVLSLNADRHTVYEDLLRRYLPALRRLARSYSRGNAEQEDLLQEIAIALWKAFPQFRGDCSERTWLYRIAHNTAFRFVANRRRRLGREENTAPPELPADSMTPEAIVIEEQQRVRLWAFLDELPLPDRQILTLHLEGLSAAEIEVVTGITAGSIATRLTRMRKRLLLRVRKEELV